MKLFHCNSFILTNDFLVSIDSLIAVHFKNYVCGKIHIMSTLPS